VHLAADRDLFTRLGASRLRLLALPLKTRQGEMVGTLTLGFDVADDADELEPLDPSRVAFVKALSGTAAVAIDNQQLLRARKQLLDSFIQLVAGAIDAKSPYTGGHCQRVPELARLLAEAACAAQEGPFADFDLSAEGWEALHIASWLHDCGKVTTPEFVVDKATKLETIHNRIHEIRTRFEVLKRDATIAGLEQALGPVAAAEVHHSLVATHARLDADFAFVAACNIGGESLGPEQLQRLREIAQRRWWRTLDDSLGLSFAEAERLPRPRPSLPAQERLLADRPEHVIRRSAADRIPADNPLGLKLDEPEYLYHRGELYNLSIPRGTLTEEERFKINDHIVQTLRMLRELPFPRHLRRVPEIASGHHERMDGRGYPRGLTREQMSVEARIMAVADVFEALTADDRPYKLGKPLSEALTLMARMRRDGHIDPELFDLFVDSGALMAYSRRFLLPSQQDVEDPRAFLANLPA
jgi:HD-GYP domain-containing protein (c-di-GMP phosphodiesterase class II)